MTRVTIVMDALATGGTERQMELLLRHWPQERASVQVLAFQANASDRERFARYAPVHVLNRRGRTDLGFASRFRSAVRAGETDVVLAAHRFAGLMSLTLLGRSRDPAVVCSIRGRHQFSSLQRILYDGVHPWLCGRRASAVLVNARPEIDALVARRPSLRGRIHWIPNGVVVERFDRTLDREAWCARHGLDPTRPIVASVGRLVEVKDPLAALEAIASEKLTDRGVQLVWAGDGDLRPTVENAAESMGIADRLHLLGDVDDPADLLAVADAYLHTSLWENTSNAILEAMAARCPVVARRVGGTPDLLLGGEAGVLVDDSKGFGGALHGLLVDQSATERRTIRARQEIESHYAVEAMVEAHMSHLEAAVAVRSRRISGQ